MITVIDPGPLTSVQDPGGRPGWRRYGVPVGGAADAWSARLANRLVGNPDDVALLEVTLGGATFRLEVARAVAVTGELEATIDGRRLASSTAIVARGGATVRVDPGAGARGYLAVAGGIDVEEILGSPSTDLRTGFGGHVGRALRAGDTLVLGRGSAAVPAHWTGTRSAGPIRMLPGPQPEAFDALVRGVWTVGIEADRAGVRLDGDRIGGSGEIASMGLPIGAVQIPPDGRPIVMLTDRPVTGGYPVPACVIRADVDRVAQLRPGHEVRFASVTVEDAISALVEAERALAEVERHDELGWAGSHG